LELEGRKYIKLFRAYARKKTKKMRKVELKSRQTWSFVGKQIRSINHRIRNQNRSANGEERKVRKGCNIVKPEIDFQNSKAKRSNKQEKV
jgi:hypothetical protein